MFNLSELLSSKLKVLIRFLTAGLNCHLVSSLESRETDLFSETNHLFRDSVTGE